MKIGCVILNYNDSETTIKLIKKIAGYESIEKIVVVDNKSTDNSVEELTFFISDKIALIISDSNKGYSTGNNTGLRYLSSFNLDYVIIANPDIEFDENHIFAGTSYMEISPNVAVTSFCSVNAAGEKTFQPAWKTNNLTIELLSSSKLLRNLFKRNIYYNNIEINKEKYLFVDVLPGSFLILRYKHFEEIGFFDENVFLYCEERILASKLKQKSYKSVLITDNYYVHNHSTSINKSIKSYYLKESIWLRSRKYYLINYRNKFLYTKIFIQIFFVYLRLELVLVSIIKKMVV